MYSRRFRQLHSGRDIGRGVADCGGRGVCQISERGRFAVLDIRENIPVSRLKRNRLMIEQDVDWSKCEDVESVPGRLSGAWVIKGTRVPAQAVVDNARAGCTAEEIATEIFELPLERVKGVLRFAKIGTPSKDENSARREHPAGRASRRLCRYGAGHAETGNPRNHASSTGVRQDSSPTEMSLSAVGWREAKR